ncbi:MAG: gamma-glutamyl-gamma-aminobutyrate hydrolase family protein [Candidatus Calescibacterium sp.]|nr:gamma-glutamyl-gamma-aminobutyrate hydrolase family protein [Candidatus Calescibacterium sp.]MDW8132182.1 gamma-glutamyl-gamma-aminobutyrate hydrolase family protein [Candidatus Calescibacterium sp.]
MKVGLVIKKDTNHIVFEEYINFCSLMQNEINKKLSKNSEIEILEINSKINQKLREIDIIVLSGGEDVHPEYYNSKVKYSESLYNFNKERDEIELEILEKFHQTKPIFGICRGIQIINVFLRGALFQHLPYDIRGTVIDNAHKIYPEIEKFEDKRKLRHIIKGKIFDYLHFDENIKKENFMYTNSRHHQAISKLGKNLEILALSKDGIVEIMKHMELPILAVQYHPEQKEIVDYQLPLIKYFLNLF